MGKTRHAYPAEFRLQLIEETESAQPRAARTTSQSPLRALGRVHIQGSPRFRSSLIDFSPRPKSRPRVPAALTLHGFFSHSPQTREGHDLLIYNSDGFWCK